MTVGLTAVSFRKLVVSAFVVLGTFLAAIHPVAVGQTTAGSLHGVITDATGAVIPGVEIEVKSEETGATRQALTNSLGLYTSRELPPGHYTVRAKKPGFSTVVGSNIDLLVNQDLDISLTMSVGENAQQVEVQASTAAVATTNSTLGSVVGGHQIVDLPLNGRQFTQLILLTPGAVPKEAGQQSAFIVPLGSAGISPSVNGQRAQQNNFTLDGVSNNAIFTNTWTVSPPPDAIQEFKIQSHITEAEFGNSPELTLTSRLSRARTPSTATFGSSCGTTNSTRRTSLRTPLASRNRRTARINTASHLAVQSSFQHPWELKSSYGPLSSCQTSALPPKRLSTHP